MTWIYLAIIAYFLWAITNIIDKVLISKYIKDYFSLTLMGLFIGSLLIFLYIIFTHGFFLIAWTTLLLALLSGLVRILAYVFYFKSLSYEEVSRVTILTQLVPVFTLIIAYFFINEVLTIKGDLSFAIRISIFNRCLIS